MHIRKQLSKAISFVLALIMLVTLLPTNYFVMAASNMNATIHFYNSSSWGKPTIQAWSSSEYTVDNYNSTFTYSPYGGATVYELKEDTVTGSGWYSVSLSGNPDGFQIINALDTYTDGGQVETTGNLNVSQLDNYSGDVYYKGGIWYTDSACTQRLVPVDTTSNYLLVGDIKIGDSWNETATDYFTRIGETTGYTYTLNSVPAGNYSYVVLKNNSWNGKWGNGGNNRSYSLTAPANLTFTFDVADTDMNVNIVPSYYEDINMSIGSQVQTGATLDLPSTCTYYDGNGNTLSAQAVSYSVKSSNPSGATISNGTLSVNSSYSGSSVVIEATSNGFSKDYTINVVSQMYDYTIYYYDPYNEAVANASDVWMWQNDGTIPGQAVVLSSTEYDSDNDITWAKGTASVTYANLGMKSRTVAGDWNGGGDSTNRTIDLSSVMSSSNTSATIYYVKGQGLSTTKPEITPTETRHILLEYNRADNDYSGWNVYSWNNGIVTEFTADFTNVNGKWVADIEVAANVTSVSFCVRQSIGEDLWHAKDGGDHAISIPLDQTIVKAVMNDGSEPILQYPYNKGYEIDAENGSVSFYYRDDEAYLDDTISSLGTVKVEVDGNVYNMTYNADNQRYEYKYSSLTEGTHQYRYNVNGDNKVDVFNANSDEDYSYYDYYKFDASLSATVGPNSINYNQNAVLSIELSPVGGDDISGLVITEAYVDASTIGGSSKLAIDPELNEVTIAVNENISLGAKTLPVTVIDQYGNKYTAEATVNVVARDASSDDFDWDEAIIYFMQTDRFYDGNSSNNDASGAETTGTNEGLYHGGDFAGVTAKLDYLQDLGINTIWLSPIVDNISGTTVTGTGSEDVPYCAAYHGYWANDFTSLEDTFGTPEEFETLIEEAHKRGIKIMVDVVLNHAGYGTLNKAEFAGMFRTVEVEGSVIQSSQSGMPDFLTENEEVRNKLIQWQTAWMSEFDIDYYRVDTVKHVDNTTWSAFKNELTKINPNFKLIGEYYGAGYATDGEQLNVGRMDSLLDFDFNDFAMNFVTGSISSVESLLEKRNAAITNTATLGSFLGSHDEDGLQYTLQKTHSENEAYSLMKVAASLQLTSKGQAVIYYGEEIGLTGANNYPYQTNRYDFDWSMTNDSNTMYTHYKKLLSIRNEYSKVLSKGTRNQLAVSDEAGYLVFQRSYNNQDLLVGLNITDANQDVTFTTAYAEGTKVFDVYNNNGYTVGANGSLTITIPGSSNGGTAILTVESSDEGTHTTITDCNTGIFVTGTFLANVKLVISKLTSGDSIMINIATALKNLGISYKDFVAYDISFMRNNIKYTTSSTMTVNIPKPDGFSNNIAVYYVNETTFELTNMNAKLANNVISFDTNHNSIYIVVDLGENSSTTNTITTNSSASVPKTGDNMYFIFVICLGFISAVGFVATSKKRILKKQ